jgi:hypothetical protein
LKAVAITESFVGYLLNVGGCKTEAFKLPPDLRVEGFVGGLRAVEPYLLIEREPF